MNARKLIPILGVALLACTPSNLARQATRAAVDEGAEELTKPDTQADLQKAADDPKLQQATQAMSAQIAEGVLQAMESDRAKAQLTSLTRGVTQAAVQQMIAALGSEQTRAHLAGLTQGVADAALKQTARSLQTDFRPVMQTMIREDVIPGVAGVLRDSMVQPALGQAAQTVGYNIAMGANRGLGAAWQSDEGLLSEARSVPSLGRSWMWLGLGMMGLLTLMFVSAAVMLVARARHARAEVARLESATLLLATAMRERQATEQTDEILAVVQSALEGRAEKSGTHRILDALGMRKSG
ncbi:MAG: hypothetical protein JWN04_5803 [Myxococcaceae bacterium]|nr:hypothetical protein [Myxococcaceae bacterium]